MGFKQPHWVSATLLANNLTTYMAPIGTLLTPTTVEARVVFKVDQGGTVRQLRALLGTAPGGTATRTITFRKNGVDQAVTVTFAAADTSKNDTTNSLTVAAGDTLVVKLTATNTPAASSLALVWELETATTATTQYAIGTSEVSLTTSTSYAPLFSAGVFQAGGAANSDALAGAAGTITSVRYALDAAPTAGLSRTFTIVKNGTDQDGTAGTPDTRVTISDTATTGAATFTVAVAVGDLLRAKATVTGSPAAARAIGTHTFVATTPGQMVLAAVPNIAPTASTTQYGQAVGGPYAWSGTEAPRELPGPPTAVTLSGLYVYLESAMGAGASAVYTLRQNTSDTTQTVTIGTGALSAGPSAAAAVTLSSGDRFALKVVATLGSGSNRLHVGFLTIDPTAAVEHSDPFVIYPV
jgi:hypothetical protein